MITYLFGLQSEFLIYTTAESDLHLNTFFCRFQESKKVNVYCSDNDKTASKTKRVFLKFRIQSKNIKCTDYKLLDYFLRKVIYLKSYKYRKSIERTTNALAKSDNLNAYTT